MKRYSKPSTEVQTVNTYAMQETHTGSYGGDQGGAQAPRRKPF
jgi:hypothetical protein